MAVEGGFGVPNPTGYVASTIFRSLLDSGSHFTMDPASRDYMARYYLAMLGPHAGIDTNEWAQKLDDVNQADDFNQWLVELGQAVGPGYGWDAAGAPVADSGAVGPPQPEPTAPPPTGAGGESPQPPWMGGDWGSIGSGPWGWGWGGQQGDQFPPPTNEPLEPPAQPYPGMGPEGPGGGTGQGGDGFPNIPNIPPIFGGGSEDDVSNGSDDNGFFPDWVGDVGGWLGDNWQDIVQVGAPVVSAIIQQNDYADAAAIQADAMLEQGRRQEQLARDLTATGIDYANEQRDIALTGTEPYRNVGALALAGMLDMTNLDRGFLPQAPAPGEAMGQPQVQPGTGGGFDAQGNPIAASPAGQSMYDPQTSYNLDRLWDPTRILNQAPQYDWQADPSYQWRVDEGMRALEGSAAAKGGLLSGGFARDAQTYGQGMASQEFSNIYGRLAQIAGFSGQGAAQGGAPGAATQFGNPMIESLNAISGAGTSRAMGQIAGTNAWANAATQIGQWAGMRQPWQQQVGG